MYGKIVVYRCDPDRRRSPLVAILHKVKIVQLSCIDIQFQRQDIRLDVKLQLFNKLSRRTLPSRIIRIDEIADCFMCGFDVSEMYAFIKIC